MTSRLRHNVVYNLFGSVVPILVQVVTIPVYLRVLGEAHYGVLSLIWLAFGYFGIFDLGLPRAVAHRLSALRDSPLQTRVTVLYTACALNLCLGLTASTLFYLGAAPLTNFLTESPTLREGVLASLPAIAAFFPLGLLGAVMVGCLEANEKFRDLNLQQAVGSILLQCLPLGFVYVFGNTLQSAVYGTIIARAFNVCWLTIACLRWALPAGRPRVEKKYVKELLSYGVWTTMSNSIGPILTGLDQMIIGASIDSKAVAHYSVPFSMASKVLILPVSVTRALFPRLSGASPTEALDLSQRALGILASLMALICVPAILLVPFILQLWVGAEFSRDAHLPASILMVGIWFNSIAHVPYSYLQSRGRPDLVAKLHALEVVPFVLLLWPLIHFMGLPGAAVAWSLRVAADAGLLFWAAGFHPKNLRHLPVPGMAVLTAAGLAVFVNPSPISAAAWALAIGTSLMVWVFLRQDLELEVLRSLQVKFPRKKRT